MKTVQLVAYLTDAVLPLMQDVHMPDSVERLELVYKGRQISISVLDENDCSPTQEPTSGSWRDRAPLL